ncbi:MAG: GvpL/GvpF family gas vesicle protein [Chloroflexota bacterium]
MSDGQYLYCIAQTSEITPLTSASMGDSDATPLETIHYQDLTAVISHSPIQTYERSRRYMTTHTKVLEEVMANYPILPVQFGTVAPDKNCITDKLLERRYDELQTKFEQIAGKIELGLKVIWYKDVVFEGILEETPSIRTLRDQLLNQSEAESYYDRIELGKMVEAALEAKRVATYETILDPLRPIAHAVKEKPPQMDRMVVNAAFLIEAQQEAVFDAAIQELDAVLGKQMLFKYVGPVPPYNFVNIVVNWED